MSFLTSRALTRATPFLGRRTFGTSPVARKSATEAVKDTVKGVDRTISDVAVKGIDKGEAATSKAKEVAGLGASKAEGATAEVTGEAKGKASELKGEAKGKAEEVKGKMS